MRASASRALLVTGLFVLAARGVAAQSKPVDAASALLAIEDGDPLEYARLVQRVGDPAIASLLAAKQPIEVRLCAARATPWLNAPERVLVPLAGWLVARDAVLAEAAARALFSIAQRLDARELAQRELTPANFHAVIGALQAAADASWLRADLRMLATQTRLQLESVGF